MSEHIKLIWDFKGPHGEQTAAHHCIHLKEFAIMEKLPYSEIGQTKLSEMHSIAFIIVPKSKMIIYRDALKPHRGQVA